MGKLLGELMKELNELTGAYQNSVGVDLDKVDELMEENERLKNELNDIKSELENCKEDLDKAIQNANFFQKELLNRNKELNEGKLGFKELTIKINQLESDIENSINHNLTLCNENKKLELRNDDLSEKLRQKMDEVEDLQNKINEMNNRSVFGKLFGK